MAKARSLGEALAAHPLVRDYYAAQQAARTDEAARKLLTDYQQHVAHLHQLEAEQRPIEPADKRKLHEFETGMATNEALKRLMRVQADYVALMSQVNQAMDEPLVALTQSEKPA